MISTWIKGLKAKYGIDVKYIRLDNSGENRSLQKECEKQNLGIIFEFTAPGIPQQNSVVECKIPTLMGRSRAMMIEAGFSQQDKRKFWCEVISTATKLDNIMVRKERTKPPYTLFYNDEPKYKKYLRSFGEMTVIARSDGKKMRSKLDTRGKTGIFVGYADDHAGNIYRFINIQMKKIILSRDTQWLNSFWKEYKKRKGDSKNLIEEFYSHDENDQTQEESETEEIKESETEETKNSGDGNNTEEQKKLGIDIEMIGARKEELGRTRSQTKEMMSPRNESMERAELTMEDWIHETCLISAVTSGPTTQEESETEEIKESETEETKNSGDGNNTEEQMKLGIDIEMIGARKEELGRTRSQTKEMMSPRNKSMERAELTMEDWIHETCLISAVTSGPTEPKTFQEAWHSPVEEERQNWQIAIRKEIKSMINRGVWRKIEKVKIPENRRLIGNKWVFKIKRDGTYRARLVALGYSQIPQVDYTDNFAPVAHDVSFRIALARMMVEKLDSLVMDVETAFLYGDIEEEIFMKSPVGMEEIDPGSSPEDCYQLKKGIYGLCQAAIQFWRKFVDTIKKKPFGFTFSPADPCILFKENNLGICIIIMYVDDMLIIGKREQIQEFATMIQKEFSVKIQHNLADYLGCEFHMNKEKTKGWLGQLSIIKRLEQNLAKEP